MKKIWIIIAVLLFAPALLFAHQMEGGSTSGLFGLKAEYIHVLLNPIPGYGLGVGVAVLLAAFLWKQRALRITGLIIIAVSAASAWPVLYLGQHGYNSLYPQIDTESQQWLDTHMSRAERFIYVFYATAALAVAGLLCLKTLPKFATALSLATLIAGTVSLGAGAWISRAGGQVSHSEFRKEGDHPPSEPGHSHGGPQQSAEPIPNVGTNEFHHSEQTKSGHPAGHEKMPDADEHKQHDTTAIAPPETAKAATTNTQAQGAPDHAEHEPKAPTSAPAHEHAAATNVPSAQPEHVAHDHPTEKPGTTSAAPVTHAHSSTSEPSPGAPRLTDSIEGIWSALHKHHVALASTVKAHKFDEIHPHAVAIAELTTNLVSIVHPDHKASIQAGADKIRRAVSDMHKASHAEDPAALDAKFKLFEESLTQLQEQMRKQ